MQALKLLFLAPRSLLVSRAARAARAAENLAIRRQLVVLRRRVKRPKLRRSDRLFWVLRSRLRAGWRSSLAATPGSSLLSALRPLMLTLGSRALLIGDDDGAGAAQVVRDEPPAPHVLGAEPITALPELKRDQRRLRPLPGVRYFSGSRRHGPRTTISCGRRFRHGQEAFAAFD